MRERRGHVQGQLASDLAEAFVIPDLGRLGKGRGELDGCRFRCHDCRS